MSDKDCKNDCTMPLRFPRRPGTEQTAVHGDECQCCNKSSTHISQDNRPSLPRFNYRIGTYGSIREFLFNRIDMTPELQNWTHRAPDDPAVALLEGASMLGDILAFYQETYANEAYLRTARWRESIADLVRLLGYRLSPAVGGNGVFAFELKKDEPVTIPAGFPLKATLDKLPKPADFETVEEVTAYPWLSRFNLFMPLEDGNITPDTTEFYISYTEQTGEPVDLKVGDRLLVGDPQIDAFSGSGGKVNNAEIVIVDKIREQHGRKYYTIKGKLKRGSNSLSLLVYRIGRTFHHFGYNAPQRIVNTSAAVTSTATITDGTTSTTSTIPYIDVPLERPVQTAHGFSGRTIGPKLGDTQFPLDSEIKDLPNNVPVVIQASYTNEETLHTASEKLVPEATKVPGNSSAMPLDNGHQSSVKVEIGKTGPGAAGLAYDAQALNQFYRRVPDPLQTAVRIIKDVRISAVTWGGLDGTVSQLTLNAKLDNAFGTTAKMRIPDALFHEVTSPLFTFKRAKFETSASTGNILCYYGTQQQAKDLKGRRIMLDYPDAEPEILTVTDVGAISAAGTGTTSQLHTLTLSDGVAYAYFPNENPIVTVFGNLVNADEGKTLPETPVGSGDANLVFQNFKLPKSPLTYHIVPENTPSETPEVAIYVDGREWEQVDSLFGHGNDEHIYIVREDAEGNSWVQFGDGKTGARLTSGTNNVTAIYRIGDGAYGPLKDDTKVQASAKLKNLDKIGMPSDATGGAPPEDGENAKYAGPGKVQSLGRIVSLKDFEAEAVAIPGVASASAAWALVDNIPGVVVTVLMETGRSTEIAAVRDTLNAYNTQRGTARHTVNVLLGKRMYVTVSVQYSLRPTYRADFVEPMIRRALGVNFGKATGDEDQTGLFSLRKRRIHEREYASRIEGTVQNVDGVLWAKTVAFTGLTDSDNPAAIVMPSISVLDPIVACDDGHILSLFDKHLILSAVKEEGN